MGRRERHTIYGIAIIEENRVHEMIPNAGGNKWIDGTNKLLKQNGIKMYIWFLHPENSALPFRAYRTRKKRRQRASVWTEKFFG